MVERSIHPRGRCYAKYGRPRRIGIRLWRPHFGLPGHTASTPLSVRQDWCRGKRWGHRPTPGGSRLRRLMWVERANILLEKKRGVARGERHDYSGLLPARLV